MWSPLIMVLKWRWSPLILSWDFRIDYGREWQNGLGWCIRGPQNGGGERCFTLPCNGATGLNNVYCIFQGTYLGTNPKWLRPKTAKVIHAWGKNCQWSTISRAIRSYPVSGLQGSNLERWERDANEFELNLRRIWKRICPIRDRHASVF